MALLNTPLRRRTVIALPLLGVPLAGCMGIDVLAVRRADASTPPAAGHAVAVGRIRFTVDGQPLQTHLLNKPALELFHRGQGRLMVTPEADAEGHYRWQLPAGDYGVAVIRGGMAPTDQPHFLPGGGLVFVHGLVDPGLAFTLTEGATIDLGTLFVDVETKPQKTTLWGEGRVFGRLLGLRIEPGPTAGAPGAPGAMAGLQAPMRRIDPREARRGDVQRPRQPETVLPPINPQILQPFIR
jgi:hypothetical protein